MTRRPEKRRARSWFRSQTILAGALLSIVACSTQKDDGAVPDAGAGGAGGPDAGLDSAHGDVAVDHHTSGTCAPVTRRQPCTDQSAECIQDLRGERSRFNTCQAGFATEPFVVSCGVYDGVVYAGIDSAETYYFDHVDGHLVGRTNTGVTTLPACESFDSSFVPTVCDSPPLCPAHDAGPDT